MHGAVRVDRSKNTGHPLTQPPNANSDSEEEWVLQSLLKEPGDGPCSSFHKSEEDRKGKLLIDFADGPVIRRRTFNSDPDYEDYRYYALHNPAGLEVPPFVPLKDEDINRPGARTTRWWIVEQRKADVAKRTKEWLYGKQRTSMKKTGMASSATLARNPMKGQQTQPRKVHESAREDGSKHNHLPLTQSPNVPQTKGKSSKRKTKKRGKAPPATRKTGGSKAAKGTKYYAVAVGHVPGIYLNDRDARLAYERYSNPVHRCFESRSNAVAFMRDHCVHVWREPDRRAAQVVDSSAAKPDKPDKVGTPAIRSNIPMQRKPEVRAHPVQLRKPSQRTHQTTLQEAWAQPRGREKSTDLEGVPGKKKSSPLTTNSLDGLESRSTRYTAKDRKQLREAVASTRKWDEEEVALHLRISTSGVGSEASESSVSGIYQSHQGVREIQVRVE